MRNIWMLAMVAAAVLAGCKREPIKAGSGTNAPAVSRPVRIGPPATEIAVKEDRAHLLDGFYDLGTLGEGIATTTPDGEKWAKYKNGLMIHELRPSSGGVLATLGMTVSVAYTGTIPETGRVFDKCDAAHPLTFRMGSKSLIKGFSLALVEMRTGAIRRVYVPAELAYGDKGSPNAEILPGQALIFEIELLSSTGTAIAITSEDLPKFEPLGPPKSAATAPGSAPAGPGNGTGK